MFTSDIWLSMLRTTDTSKDLYNKFSIKVTSFEEDYNEKIDS